MHIYIYILNIYILDLRKKNLYILIYLNLIRTKNMKKYSINNN